MKHFMSVVFGAAVAVAAFAALNRTEIGKKILGT